ncbi:hypothetical protein ACQEU3_44770 [Spirillospora sp. CA-253888]
MANRAGRERVLADFAADLALAWEPLVLETAAQALNPAQTLIRDGSLRKLSAELTVRAGKVVWDLNGKAAQKWTPDPSRMAGRTSAKKARTTSRRCWHWPAAAQAFCGP